MSEKRIFNDILPILDTLLEKQRSSWSLEAVRHVDFDDIKQDIVIHVWKKFNKWDQKRPVEPWLSSIIHNQIFNKKRNLWGGKTKPCSEGPCFFNVGGGCCSYTKSKLQTAAECPLLREWEKKKKADFEISMAKDIEQHQADIKNHSSNEEIDYEGFIKKVDPIIKKMVDQENSPVNLVIYKVFRLLYVDKRSEEFVAKELGYKTSEANRSPGYKQIANHKAIIKNIVKELLAEEEYLFIK